MEFSLFKNMDYFEIEKVFETKWIKFRISKLTKLAMFFTIFLKYYDF